MKNNKIKIIILFIIFSIFLNIIHYYDFTALRWFDIPTHFIGGAAVAMFLPFSLMTKKPVLIISLLFIIGVGWEFFEVAVSNLAINDFVTGISEESIKDKIQDLIAGFAGLVCVYWKQKQTKFIQDNK